LTTERLVRFEVLTAVVTQSSVVWDIKPCSSLKVTDISDEKVASTFRAEESVRKKTSMKQAARKQKTPLGIRTC
jgi:hypothetical protein